MDEEEYPAEWGKYGRGADYKRNIQMLKEGDPDLVLAFPGGRGTENMIAEAKKAGVPVILADIDNLDKPAPKSSTDRAQWLGL